MNLLTNNKGNLFSEVKNSLKIEDVVTRLGSYLKQQNKTTLVGTCPTGHPSKSKTSFTVDTSLELCHCFNCRVGGDVFSLVKSVKKLNNNFEALEWLVKEYNLKVDTTKHQNNPKISSEEEAKEKELIAKSFLLEKIVDIGKQKLFEEEGTEALDYLVKERNYDPKVIKQTEWFYLPEDYDIKTELISMDEDAREAIGSLKLQGYFGDNFRLAFPYRSSEGFITGFMKRATAPKGITVTTFDGKLHDCVRWDSTPGLAKDDLFGLDKVEKSEQTLIVVEGYPDAIYLQALGMKNIVAIGQGNLGKNHFTELRKRKTKNLVIAFDNDSVGPKNTMEAVEMILKNSNITPYVMDPYKYGTSKDPDEYFRNNGFEQLQQLFSEEVEDGQFWVVKGLTKDYEKRSPLEKKEIKSKVLDFIGFVKDETAVTNILESLAITLSEKATVIKKQLKDRKKDYSDELADHITNDPIVPFLDTNSNTRCYYDSIKDVLNFGVDKDFIRELMLDYGLVAPQEYPTFTVKFDPKDMGGKFDLYHKTFNLFTPTEYMFLEKNNTAIDLAKDCPAINTVICNVIPDATERERFINWLSFTFNTRNKSVVAWLIRGVQGSGKNLMFQEIITPLWGKNHCSVVDNSALDNQFNPYIKHKMMIAYNEVTTDYRSDKKDKVSKIKTYVSDLLVNINEKNVRQYTLENFSNSLFFSNYQVPIIIEDDDRRFNVVENFAKLKHHSGYTKYKTHLEFVNAVQTELRRFAEYLINFKYNENTANEVFMNEAKKKIVRSSMGMFEEFAKKLIEKDYEWLREESGVYESRQWDLECVNKGYILKEVALVVFNLLNGKNLSSPKILSTQLQHYGIKIDGKVSIGNTRVNAYTW